MTDRVDILVSGGSFNGLALALALAKAEGLHLAIAVADRGEVAPPQPVEDLRASALSAASVHLLQALGVWDGIAPQAEPVREIEIADGTPEHTYRPTLLAYDNALSEHEMASVIVPNEVIAAALAEAVRGAPAIALLPRHEATGLAVTGPLATVAFTDGATVSAGLVAAAEGRRSRLREAAGIKTVGWGYDQRGIVTTVSHEKPHNGVAVQHFLPAGPFAMLPLKGGYRTSIVWSEEAAEAARILALDDAGFLAELDRRFGSRLGALRLDGPRGSWPLEMHLARRFVAPRLALVGDTARGVHPIAGQGLNIGLRDVAALAEAIADARRLGLDIGSDAVLERYQRWRRFDSVASASAMDGINRLFSNDVPLVRSLRDFGLRMVDRAPRLKGMIVREAAGLTGELPRLLKGEAL